MVDRKRKKEFELQLFPQVTLKEWENLSKSVCEKIRIAKCTSALELNLCSENLSDKEVQQVLLRILPDLPSLKELRIEDNERIIQIGECCLQVLANNNDKLKIYLHNGLSVPCLK